MIPEVDAYEWNDGSIKGRQHIINHVDMLFGLGDKEWSNNRNGIYAFSPIGRDNKPIIAPLWAYDNEAIKQGRNHILYQSLFAESWDQIFPMHEGKYYSPDDLQSEDDFFDLLTMCLDIWVYSDDFCGGDFDQFCKKTSLVVLMGNWDPICVDRIVIRRRPRKDFDTLPVPINGKKNMQRRHGGSVEWRAFSDRICQNEHVQEHLAGIQDGICPICGGRLGKHIVIHHVDYDHECAFALSDDNWTLPGKRVQPDCKRCHMEHPEMFEDCLSRLRAVHRDCNYLIEATL